jgi:hypothetical protein
MYPLNMCKPGHQPGFAVANDEAEHLALTEQGYEPPMSAAPQATEEKVISSSVASGEPDGAAPDQPKRKPGRPKKAE